MTLLLIFGAIAVYSLVIGYGMYEMGYSSGFAKAYYYAMLLNKAKKKKDEDETL
jgi:hypothetical protein